MGAILSRDPFVSWQAYNSLIPFAFSIEGGIEMAYAGGVAAAAAAKRRRMRLAEEEEDMARYTQDDLGDDWEFKIVRSDSAAFAIA